MGALSADYAWTSEDDFKLKTAAQGGVPLESLATGAVQFSKQFTVQELHDRWHALLYDPIIAAEASARMLEYEFFALSQNININVLDNIEEVSKKRKPEGVRKRYYAMRKRMRVHPLNPLDLTFPNETCNTICVENEDQQPPAIDFLVDEVVTNIDADMDLDVNQQTLHHENQNPIGEEENYVDESDEFQELYDLLEEEGPELLDINPQTLNSSQFHFKEEHQPMETTTSDYPIKLENGICTDSYLMEISNTLFEEDDIHHMDADSKVIDKSYIDDLSSLLLDSPKRDATCDSFSIPFADEFYKSEESKCSEGIMGISGTNYKPVIICTLNTEDPDIPSNDDVFLLPFTSPCTMQNDIPRPSPHKPSNKDSGVNWNRDFKIPKPKDNKFQKLQFETPQLRTEQLQGHGIEEGLINNDGQHEGQPQVNSVVVKSEPELHHGSGVYTNCGKSNGIVGNNVDHTLGTIQEEEALHETESKEVGDTISAVLQLPIDDDMSSLSDDDDIPSYSDVEAMILDEKLSEDEKGLYLNGNWSYRNLQTVKYNNPSFQRSFIRLEQAANGYMKRDMSSWEAFAVLQGWQFIYYIKKPEILMGRATEDVIVDVDLGREGSDSRISRRQAIIQLNREGLFRIKNLGKYSIFVNSDELSRNQSTTLTSSCLIEIRGMPFLFETNEEGIKRYVETMKNKSDVDD